MMSARCWPINQSTLEVPMLVVKIQYGVSEGQHQLTSEELSPPGLTVKRGAVEASAPTKTSHKTLTISGSADELRDLAKALLAAADKL